MKKQGGSKRFLQIFLSVLLLSAGTFHTGCEKRLGVTEGELEQQILARVNQYRVSRGLSELVWDEDIANQCRTHSRNMASGTVPFSHDGFEVRINNIGKVIPLNGSGENVAYNHGYDDPAEVAFNSWLIKEEHKINMEGNYDLTGIGVSKNDDYEFYFTQIFVKKKSQ